MGRKLPVSEQASFEKVPVNVNNSKTQIGLEAPHLESADFVCLTKAYKLPEVTISLFHSFPNSIPLCRTDTEHLLHSA